MKFGVGLNINMKYLQFGGLCEYIEVEFYIFVKFLFNCRKLLFKGFF